MKKIKLTLGLLIAITFMSSCSSNDDDELCSDRVISIESSSTNGVFTYTITHGVDSNEIIEDVDEVTYNFYLVLFSDDDFTNDCWEGRK